VIPTTQPAQSRTRDDLVDAQYSAPAAATGYAAAHEGFGPTARYFHSRITLVSQTLASCAGGDLLDVGCGPGMMVRHLIQSRPGDFRITAIDRSPAMISACAANVGGATGVAMLVGRVEAIPLPDASIDVALAMGVLEYADAAAGLAEMARVIRPGGLVIVTMLNPVSPYRLFEWHVYWPLRRVLRAVETALRIPAEKRHGAMDTGIHAYRERQLREMLTSFDLRPVDVAYYDVTPLVPPIDRLVRRWARSWKKRPERTISRGWRRWLGTAYLIAARAHGPM
jgi:ubiquinone/menaquinone biosynthesis C-methylase UbiE